MKIGVLALQGAFAEHEERFHALGADCVQIRGLKDLDGHFDGLVLPGGESTVMGKLMRCLGLFLPLRERILCGLPVLGTCAGMILLAREVVGGESHFGTMDIRVKRNAYGRQLGSFYVREKMEGVGVTDMAFIRAPYIEQVFGQAQVLARAGGHIVAARQGNQLALAFHPELGRDMAVHRYFPMMCCKGAFSG